MNINLEATESNTIQAYDNNKIQINSIVYENSLIVSREEIIKDVTIHNIQDINDSYVELLLKLNPELILIGHSTIGKFLPLPIISQLSQQRIGIEAMSIGAACRTYNVLLSENRAIVLGLIF